MSDTDITICAKCKHFSSKPDGPRTLIWYNLTCLHPDLERPLGIDPVTGRETHFIRNDLGRIVPTDDKHPYCRDINDGYCKRFEPTATEDVSPGPSAETIGRAMGLEQ